MKHFFTSGLLLFLPFCLFAQLSIQTMGTNVSCFGGNNGTAKAIPNGGIEPYAYVWSNGGSTDNIASLSAGTYSVTVTDNNGSSISKSVIITQPPLLGSVLNGQPQICTLAPDGFAYVIPTGGSAPFTFAWSNGVSTQLNNYLTANSYTVTVTDTKGCTATGSYTVGLLGLGLYLITDSEAATCPEPFNGSASIAALSGNGPYVYQWSNGADTPDLDSLYAGEYDVTVMDVNGCSASASIIVAQENVDSNSVQILIPQCVGDTFLFESSNNYQVYDWTFNNPLDSVISGAGSSTIQVKWGAEGPKDISVNMRDTITQCETSTRYTANVYVCMVNTTNTLPDQVEVAPNPFNDFIGIRFEGSGMPEIEAQLFDYQGKILSKSRLFDQACLIDTQTLTPGIYVLKLSDGRGSSVRKLVKN